MKPDQINLSVPARALAIPHAKGIPQSKNVSICLPSSKRTFKKLSGKPIHVFSNDIGNFLPHRHIAYLHVYLGYPS